MTNKLQTLALAGLLAVGLASCNYEDPGLSDETPQVRWGDPSTTSGAERGAVMINEVNFAGSVTDDGEWDPDDIFIEILNKHVRPINISGWRLTVKGAYGRSYRIPHHERAIAPNDYFIIAKKRDGAFSEVADVFIEDLELSQKQFYIELRDYDHRLMESAGSKDLPPFAGGYDLVTVRSMERVQIIFGNTGSSPRSWHAYSDDETLPTVREGWRKFTLASPGASNSADYSGNTTSGTFD